MIHPGTWLVITLWITSIAVLENRIEYLVGLLGVALLISFLANGRKLWGYLKALKILVPVIASVFVVQVLLRRDGDELWRAGFVAIYSGGLALAAQVSLRLVILLVSASILKELAYQDFRLALKWLPAEISFMIAYIVHLLPQLRAQFRLSMQNLSLRGIKIKSLAFKDKLKVYRIVSLTVLGGLLAKSDLQAIQLELRGFRRQGKKSFLHPRSLQLVDYLVLIALVALSALLLLI